MISSATLAATSRLTSQQRAEVASLAATDRRVRAHEQAHLAAAGPYATSGASYGFTVGPDGQRYATSGEVNMDASPDPGDPEKTIQKERVIQAAAYAPVDPSNQDRMVAAMAAQMEAAAEAQLAQQQRSENQSGLYGAAAAAAAAYNPPQPDSADSILSLLL